MTLLKINIATLPWQAWLILLFILGLVILVKFHRNRLQLQQKEDYIILPSASGITWYLGRRMNWHVPHPDHPDSKPFLESLGFCILGLADEMRYAVEPPKGWQMRMYGPRLHSYVVNENDMPQFWCFEKQEYYEFKAYIYENKEMNERVVNEQRVN